MYLNSGFFLSCLYFSVFALKADIYSINLYIQCECGENTDQKRLRIRALYTVLKMDSYLVIDEIS